MLRKELADDINDFSTDALLSFGGGSTDMGGAADMGMAVKSLVLAGFFCPNIKTCCINLTAVECIKQSCFVNICAAAGINDNNAALMIAPPSTAGA